MAVLNKLRNSKWVLVVVLLSLGLFVANDYFSSRNSGVSGSSMIGEINGTEISVAEFDNRYKELLSQLSANGSEENQNSRDQASTYAWNQFIQTLVIDKEYAKLGIDISPDEAGKLLYSNDAHATIKQYFTRDGQFSPSDVLNFKNQMAKKDPKMMAQFELILKQVFMEVQSRKYNSLIDKSLYGTTIDAEDDYFATATRINGQSISLNFAGIDDKTIKVEDSELKEYIKTHKEDFKQKASRDIEYVLFNITASKKDTISIREEVEGDKINFKNSENDSIFLALNSVADFSNEFQPHGSINQQFETELFNLSKDSVFGPVYYDGGYSIFKMSDRKIDSVYYFHAIKAELPIKGATKKDTLDAIAEGNRLIKEAAASNETALDFFNIKVNDGELTYAQDLGWLREETQTDEVNKAVNTLSNGQAKVVKSVYGLSIVKLIAPKSSDVLKIAELRKSIEPLAETQNEAFQKASNFRSELSGDNKDEFETQIKKSNLNKSLAKGIKEGDKIISNIPGTTEVARWVNDEGREVGDYSDVIAAEDILIVAHLVTIKKEGTADLEDVRDEVTRLVKNEKKGVILKKQMEDAMKGSNSMEDIAIKLKTIVQPFADVNMNINNVQFTGNDPQMVGYVCGIDAGKMSKPIVSNEGIHLLFVQNIDKPELPSDLSMRKNILYDQMKQQIYNSVFESLKKAANVIDERNKYY
jgi:peptidyl-prolyl cis-trans isomerase D